MATKKLINNNLETPINKEITAIVITILILLFSALVVGFAFLEYSRAYYKDKSAPSQFFEGVNISALNPLQAQTYINNILKLHLEETITFSHQDVSQEISYKKLGANTNFNRNFQQIKFYNGKPSRTEILRDQLYPSRYRARLTLSVDTLEKNLISHFPELSPPQPAQFYWNQLALEVLPETIGNNTNFEYLRKDILTGKTKLEVPVKIKYPTVTRSDLEPLHDQFSNLISAPIRLTYGSDTYQFNLGETPEIVVFDKVDGELVAKIDQDAVQSFIDLKLNPEISKEPETLEISYQDGRAVFSGIGQEGLAIKEYQIVSEVNTLINDYLINENQSILNQAIAIQTEKLPPNLIIASELQNRGIKEMVSYGYTTFHGSPNNRIHNINVSSNNYNGIIIPQGEVFSFNNYLGPINAAAGYRPELVIKGEQTVPEYGGGICQVSTTVYRGALFGGFDITERHNHSYTVSYYAQVLGHGLDATIYRGSKDLQFRNDTPGDLVMQLFTEGTTMTVRFFGTNDGRTVDINGPIVLGQTPAGQAVYEVDPSLPPGTRKQVDQAISGLSTQWKRTITRADGTSTEENIISRFRAVPPKFLVSTDYNTY